MAYSRKNLVKNRKLYKNAILRGYIMIAFT